MGWIAELRRRKVFRLAGIYAVAAWLVLQVGSVTFEPLGLPVWSMTLLTWLALGGFPIAMVLGWFFDFTSGGIVRASAVASAGEDLPLKPMDYGILTAVGVVALLFGYSAYQGISTDRDGVGPVEVATPARSIAVMPFVSLSADSDLAFLGDGLAEELLRRLSRIAALKVTAAASSFSFRGQDIDLPSIAEALGVESILEGSVRRVGNRIQVTAQLVGASDGFRIWSEEFNGDFDEIFEVEDQIATSIFDALQIELVDEPALRYRPTTSMEAYERYLQGRVYIQDEETDSLNLAIEAFTRATELDQNFAEAWAGLAEARMLLYTAGWEYGDFTTDRSIEFEQAKADTQPAIIRALAINPSLADAHMVNSLYQYYFERDRELALETAKRAVELNPNFAPGLKHLGVLLDVGRLQMTDGPDVAIPILERARDIDPLDIGILERLRNSYVWSGQFDLASETAELMVELDPADLENNLFVAMDLIDESGAVDLALPYIRRAYEIDPTDARTVSLVISVHMILREYETARQWIYRLESQDPGNFMVFYSWNEFLSVTGDLDGLESLIDPILQEVDFNDRLDDWSQAVVLSAVQLYRAQGRMIDAERMLEVALRGPFNTPIHEIQVNAALAHVLRSLGRNEESDAAISETLRKIEASGSGSPYITFYTPAFLAALEGDTDKALEFLYMYREVSPLSRFDWLTVEPVFSELTMTPEYRRFMTEVEADIAQVREEIYASGLLPIPIEE